LFTDESILLDNLPAAREEAKPEMEVLMFARTFAKTFLATFVLLTAQHGALVAQQYPTRQVTVIVPYAAGGPTDTIARQIAPLLGEKLGQTVVVENVTGGSSTLGTARVARSVPDGHTILLHNLAISANVSLFPHLTFHPEKDLAPIIFVNSTSTVLIGRKSLTPNTLAELGAWLRMNTAKFAYPGPGTTGHLITALYSRAVGATVNYIPYRGAAPAMQDILAGNVDLFFAQTISALGPLQAGTIKAYGITSTDRSGLMPEVPSMVQALGADMDIQLWHAVFAPAATPKPVITKLNKALQEIIADPKLMDRWAKSGIRVYPRQQQTPAAAVSLLGSEIKRWEEIIRANKIAVSQ
jgi:tripartite-type tricarboxylate transporter receptor subunit TctC